MSDYSRSQFSNSALVRRLASDLERADTATAHVLASIGEIDARKLFLAEAYPSMRAYCEGAFALPREAAHKRIVAARAARRFPQVLDAVADRRLHLSAVVLLAPYLTQETVDELLAAASHQSKSAIERLLAERFPKPDVPTRVVAILAPAQVLASEDGVASCFELSPGKVGAPLVPLDRATPLSPERLALQVTIERATHDKLCRAQELLGHAVPSGNVGLVIDRALDALIAQLERKKFAATQRPRASRRASRSARYVPAHVKRAVRERDCDRCTFVSDSGRRCEARTRLEFDHVLEVARGGQASVEGIRLRCRAHNQFTAEQTFGEGFMQRKRDESRDRLLARSRAAAMASSSKRLADDESDDLQDVVPWLQTLSISTREARWAAERLSDDPQLHLAERVKKALGLLAPAAGVRHERPVAARADGVTGAAMKGATAPA